MTRDETLDLLHHWQSAVDQRDLDAYRALYSEDAEIFSPLAGAVSGRDGAEKSLRTFLAAFPDVTFATEPPIVDGHRAACVSTVSGTNVGGLLGLPPSGRSFQFTIVFVLEIKNGFIVRERRLYDSTGLLVQIGVLKAKPV